MAKGEMMLFSKRLELAKRATRWIAHNTHGDFSPVNIVTALDALGVFGQAVEHRVQRTAFGSSWNVRLANLIIRLGWWVAEIGSR